MLENWKYGAVSEVTAAIMSNNDFG